MTSATPRRVLAAVVAVAFLVSAASAQVAVYDRGDLGVLGCPSTTSISGNTGTTFNIGQATGPGTDHWWRFSLDQHAIVTLESCGSWFNSAVGFYIPDLTESLATGVGNCASGGGGTVTTTLEAGEYSMIVEGATASTNDRGPYTGSLTCQPNYCPAGYGDYGVRYNQPLGRVIIVEAHSECSARCNQYSAPEFNGGCKAYQTGMYFGMIY